MEQAYEILRRALQRSKYTVFFGGAGVSTASGIPDFRGAKGLHQKYPAEKILTPRFLHDHPSDYYRFYRKYFMGTDLKPNACHLALAKLEAEGRLASIVTQNVDGLHQKAGSQHVIELHGSGQAFYCNKCRVPYSFEAVQQMPLVPRCDCGGVLRSAIVLYEEGLDQQVLAAALREIAKADLLIVGGSSLTVHPAASLIHHQRQGELLLINLTITSQDHLADIVLHQPIAELFSGFLPDDKASQTALF